MGELLPCPLCGNPNVDTDEGVFLSPGNGHTLPCWSIQCGKPGCIGIEARTRKEVVEMWNTRTPTSADAAAGDARDAAHLTRHQGAILSAFTGILCGEYPAFHEYAEKVLGRPICTHEFANAKLLKELKEASKADFIAITPLAQPAEQVKP